MGQRKAAAAAATKWQQEHGRNHAVARAAHSMVEQLERRLLMAAVDIAQPAWVQQGPAPVQGSGAVQVYPDMEAAGAIEEAEASSPACPRSNLRQVR